MALVQNNKLEVLLQQLVLLLLYQVVGEDDNQTLPDEVFASGDDGYVLRTNCWKPFEYSCFPSKPNLYNKVNLSKILSLIPILMLLGAMMTRGQASL